MATGMGKAFTGSMKKVKMPAYSSWGSVVNAQLKAKLPPPPDSKLSKFLNLPSPSASHFSDVVAKFVKIQAGRNPGRKKGKAFEDKLRAALAKEKNIGVHDIAKLMSDHFATKA